MQSDKASLLEDYKAKIKNEVHHLIQNPLTYDTTNLLDILDDIELNPLVLTSTPQLNF